MFKIYDGREYFYQWDIDRQLIVEDSTIKQVHFCNRTDDCSLVCETYVKDGLTLVNVPNILLQTDWRIRVYAYDGSYTKHDECYEVKSRTKPSDYVYTETEVITLERIEAKVDEIYEDIGVEVEKYLEENPIEVDFTGYATETYVDEAIASIDATGVSFDDAAAGIGATNVQEAIDYLADSAITSEITQDMILQNLDLYGLKTSVSLSSEITSMNTTSRIAKASDVITNIKDFWTSKGFFNYHNFIIIEWDISSSTFNNSVYTEKAYAGYLNEQGYYTTLVDRFDITLEKGRFYKMMNFYDIPIDTFYKIAPGLGIGLHSTIHFNNHLLDNGTVAVPIFKGHEQKVFYPNGGERVNVLAIWDITNFFNGANSGTDVDLTDYYTKEETEALIPDLTDYAKTEDIPSLDGYAKTEDIPDVSGYAKTEDIPDVSQYQTAEQVETAINDALSAIGVAEEGVY